MLINNAGIALYDDLIGFDAIEKHLVVNLFGTLNVTRAFERAERVRTGKFASSVRTRTYAPLVN